MAAAYLTFRSVDPQSGFVVLNNNNIFHNIESGIGLQSRNMREKTEHVAGECQLIIFQSPHP